MYTVTITQMDPGGEPVTRYSQTLDAINLGAIITAVNSKPPRVRNRTKAQNTHKRVSKKAEEKPAEPEFTSFKDRQREEAK